MIWLFLAPGFGQESGGDSWRTIQVPGAWETSNGGPASGTGYAWYRTWLKPHDSFFARHERNLFEESVSLYIRGLAGAHEVYVNGVRVGGGGAFPPAYRSGAMENHRHKVPPGTLKKGLWNEIAVRVYNGEGRGGFLTEAPFIMDYFMECVMEGRWQIRVGDDLGWKGGVLQEKPSTSAFAEFHEANRVLGEAAQNTPGERFTPAETMAKMRPHAEFQVDLLAAEPVVAQPVHISFDERGRAWVSQYRQYPYPAGLKMLSRDKYYRAQYDRTPPPPPNHDRGRDRISIHEDTDGDGIPDRHTVFMDGLNLANAAVRGHGGVWVMHTPYLLFYPDRDFDDRPDGPPEVRLQGFGLEDTHSVANGLVWGLDGWLYGAQGSTTTSRVTRPGVDGPEAPGVYFEGCMVWRYHPETRAYEIFAEGSGNAFTLEVDSEGRLYSGHNGGETRGWYYVQGAYYLKQGKDPGKFGPLRNPNAFGELPMIKSRNPVPRFSHGFAMGEGTALGREWSGLLYSIDPLHSLVMASRRFPAGSTFETEDVGAVLNCEDTGFRPVFIANAPDGTLWIADFYEHYIAHGQHYQSQIDPTTGRLYRLMQRGQPRQVDLDLASKSPKELVGLLSHPNKWHRHTAVRLLGERQDLSVVGALQGRLAERTGFGPLGALCALHQMGALDREGVAAGLKHPQPMVRAWTVRLIGDKRRLSDDELEGVVGRIGEERDAEVLAQMACTARRLPVGQMLRMAPGLLARGERRGDAYYPLLCWWMLEEFCGGERERVLSLFQDPAIWNMPLVREHVLSRVMRRFAAAGKQADLLACAALLEGAPDSECTGRLVQGFEEAYRGRAMMGLPERLAARLAGASGVSEVLRMRQGDTGAAAEVLKKVQNSGAKLEERLSGVRALGELRVESGRPVLLALAKQSASLDLQRAAWTALANWDDEGMVEEALAFLPKATPGARVAAVEMLSRRPSWALRLLEGLRVGVVDRAWLTSEVMERMRDHADARVRQRAAELLPARKAVSTPELMARMERVKTTLRSGAGNPYRGEGIFNERCASCHTLFHKGGRVGPDLTPYQRDHLDTLLMSVLNPNAEIREGFEYVQIETKDGRNLAGFVRDRDALVTVLRGFDGEDVTLKQSEILEVQAMGKSLMPEGILDDLSDAHLRDLFAYLRQSQPMTR